MINEQLKEYLSNNDKDIQSIGFELLNRLDSSFKNKVYILYSSGYKEKKDDSSKWTFRGTKNKWYIVDKKSYKDFQFIPYYPPFATEYGPIDLWGNKIQRDVPFLDMLSVGNPITRQQEAIKNGEQ